MTIRALSDRDIAAVAALHCRSMRSPGAAMGVPYLTELYRVAAGAEPWCACRIALTGTRIGGAILYAWMPDRLHAQLSPAVNRTVRSAVVGAIAARRVSAADLLNAFVFKATARRRMTSPYLYVESIYVDPDLRSRGLGSALMAEAIADARRRQLPRIYLDTLAENTGALEFYGRLGFRPVFRGFGSILLMLPTAA
jgi:ribosomal protein S18 acetylase RimI-like enzyme